MITIGAKACLAPMTAEIAFSPRGVRVVTGGVAAALVAAPENFSGSEVRGNETAIWSARSVAAAL